MLRRPWEPRPASEGCRAFLPVAAGAQDAAPARGAATQLAPPIKPSSPEYARRTSRFGPSRPNCHHWERANVKGHIFVCFLALYVAAHLRHKLAAAGCKLPWDEVVRDLCRVRAITLRGQTAS
ncbi:MAG: hypothetical protein FJ265_16070 [Planctomycetes bacterium]|nr:hypothetical protein [Planctomycetota bacterium]